MLKKIFLQILLLVSVVGVYSQTTKVACIGNSVTYGLTLKDPSTTSYPAQLQKMLGNEYEVKNFGRSGATLLKKGHNPYYKSDEFLRALAFKPDIVVIHLGLNDTDPRNWPNYGDEFKADYSWLIDTIRSVVKTAKIYICKLSPITNGHSRFNSGTRDWHRVINTFIPEIALANDVHLLDFHSPLYGRPDLLPDAIHPNEEGAKILARTVYQNLTGDFGRLRLSRVFGSHMVLQRNKPLRFSGTAKSDQIITVEFAGKILKDKVGSDGKWLIEFPSMPAGGPYNLVVSGNRERIELEDILIGDVWLCAGQSNMDFPLKDADQGKYTATSSSGVSSIRMLNMEPIAETQNYAWDTSVLSKVNQLQYFTGSWKRNNSITASDFSAVGYFFGLRLHQEVKVPIGLIQVAVGGSPTESWIDRYSMESDPLLVQMFVNWNRSDFIMPWVRERAQANVSAGNLSQRHPYHPCYNFEAGILPLIGLSIAGITWYQGESNAHNIELHEKLFPTLVASWRNVWKEELPFYFVQLSSIERPSWPAFRNSQLKLSTLIPRCGMAVSSDLGDPSDVHPKKKKEIGDRLALIALNQYYHRNIEYSGPQIRRVTRNKEILTVEFNHSKGLHTQDGKALRGFVLTDEKGFHHPANAIIKKDKILIPIKNIPPAFLQYAWEPYTSANLVNNAGLPASTFQININR